MWEILELASKLHDEWALKGARFGWLWGSGKAGNFSEPEGGCKWDRGRRPRDQSLELGRIRNLERTRGRDAHLRGERFGTDRRLHRPTSKSPGGRRAL